MSEFVKTPTETYKDTELPELTTTEPILGVTAYRSKYLVGREAVYYPEPGGFLFDLDAINFDLFAVEQSPNLVLIKPKQEGLYRVDFYAWLYPMEETDLFIRLNKTPGNYPQSFCTYHFAKRHTTEVSFTRYVKLKPGEGIYLTVYQYNDNGNTRVWVGAPNANYAKPYSGLYITKV